MEDERTYQMIIRIFMGFITILLALIGFALTTFESKDSSEAKSMELDKRLQELEHRVDQHLN